LNNKLKRIDYAAEEIKKMNTPKFKSTRPNINGISGPVVFVLVMVLAFCNCNQNPWPQGDVYDLSVRFSPGKTEYRTLLEKTESADCCDSALLSLLFGTIVTENEELVKSGRRPFVFSKGLFLEFDENLSYRDFQECYKSLRNLVQSSRTSLRLGKTGVTTTLECFDCRSEIWTERPMLVFSDSGIALRTSTVSPQHYSYKDSVALASVLAAKLKEQDKNRFEQSFGARRFMDDRLVRVVAEPILPLHKISNVLHLLPNRHKYIFKFYNSSDTLPRNGEPNLPDSCHDVTRSVSLANIDIFRNGAGFKVDAVESALKRSLIPLDYRYRKYLRKGGMFRGDVFATVTLLSCGRTESLSIQEIPEKEIEKDIFVCFNDIRLSPVCGTNDQTELLITFRFGGK